jgi:hypothetical protein
MHERLLGGANLTIFHEAIGMAMRPFTSLLTGTENGLKEVDVADSFYWIPSVVNFPGVDGVLGDTEGHVYTIQATIARDHKSPIEGIKKVWQAIPSEIRTSRTWHYVVVAKTQRAAERYVELLSKKLRNFTLGQTCVPVQVWACVLPS